jgi:hypothetical protein
MSGSTTNPQYQFYDTQNIFEADIDYLYNVFIQAIDNQRSYFNALTPGTQTLNVTQYQESRCHAFLRMMGFPVVAPDGSFYSPGYDKTLNTDPNSTNSYQQIAAKAVANTDFTRSSSTREGVQVGYNTVWATGGINATAVSIGSRFLRSFDKQFSDSSSVGPLDFDTSQIQTVDARIAEIQRFFGTSTSTYTAPLPNITISLLTSTHIIKPFAVDPRIDNGVRPASRRVAAPFATNKSQLKLFDPQQNKSVYVVRPYIETVISTIFNNQNVIQAAPQPAINDVINQIQLDPTVTDQDLINLVSNPGYTLYTSQISAFSNYLNVIRALVTRLLTAVKRINYVRQNMNWQPSPNPTLGPEAGIEGGTVSAAIAGDPNNQKIEFDIIEASQKQLLNQVQYNIGVPGADPGDFSFSNITDSVFNIQKNVNTSYDYVIGQLNNQRFGLGDEGLDELRVIEIIMGEFSGLGLLDIVAIQAAMWIVNPQYLMGMIDPRARNRLSMNQNVSGYPSASSILTSLTGFETVVKQMYKLIDSYIKVLQTQGQYTDIQNQ